MKTTRVTRLFRQHIWLSFSALAALLLTLSAPAVQAQAPTAFTCNEAYYLGQTLMSGENSYAKQFKNPQMAQLAQALLDDNVKLLEGIKDQDIYFFGRGLMLESEAELENIAHDDVFFLAVSLLQGDINILEEHLTPKSDLYYLGLCLLEGDELYLEAMSCRKKN